VIYNFTSIIHEREVVFKSPVRSGFGGSKGLDRDRDRSSTVHRPQKTGQNRCGPLYNGSMRFFAVTRPVLTSYGPNQLLTGLDRSCGDGWQFVVGKYIYFQLHSTCT
jgi:hypothetical protein